MSVGPIEVGKRRTMYSIGLVLSVVAFLVCGLWVYQIGPFPPAFVAVVLTLVGIVTFAYQLATGPYLFRIDALGIHDRSGSFQPGRVTWDQIEEVRVVVAEGREQIGLALTPEGRAARGVLIRTLMEEQRKALGIDVVIAPEAIGPETAAHHVETLRRFQASREARAELETTR